MALQRNLKALGTFGYQDDGAAQPRLHPGHSAGHLADVRSNLKQLPQFARMRELLAAHVYEFR